MDATTKQFTAAPLFLPLLLLYLSPIVAFMVCTRPAEINPGKVSIFSSKKPEQKRRRKVKKKHIRQGGADINKSINQLHDLHGREAATNNRRTQAAPLRSRRAKQANQPQGKSAARQSATIPSRGRVNISTAKQSCRKVRKKQRKARHRSHSPPAYKSRRRTRGSCGCRSSTTTPPPPATPPIYRHFIISFIRG